jgi:hypothetical protein
MKNLKVEKKSNNPDKNIPWRDNAFSMMALYSILTGMVGVFLAVIIPDKEIEDNWYWPVGLLSLSIICFVLGTEKYSDALDEDDVDKHLSWFLVYNFGVILMFFGIAAYIFLHYHLCFPIYKTDEYWNLIPFLVAFIASYKWLKDIYYLLFQNTKDYEEYKKELLGRKRPKLDPDWLMKLHVDIRKLLRR